MRGVILSGGQSTRMGQDKGLMEFNGKKWTEIVREKLTSFSISTVISINQQQLTNYSKYFPKNDLVIDSLQLKIQGPLAGLLSVHLKYPEEDIIIIACDMININSIVIEKLLDEYRLQQPEAMAFKGESIEPLCAIYSSGGLKKITASYREGALKKHSMMSTLETLRTIYLPMPEKWQPLFKNFNQAEDLN